MIGSIYDRCLDLYNPDTPVEIEIRSDGRVLWVNVEGKCVLRIKQIKHDITIKDNREDH